MVSKRAREQKLDKQCDKIMDQIKTGVLSYLNAGALLRMFVASDIATQKSEETVRELQSYIRGIQLVRDQMKSLQAKSTAHIQTRTEKNKFIYNLPPDIKEITKAYLDGKKIDFVVRRSDGFSGSIIDLKVLRVEEGQKLTIEFKPVLK